MNEKEIVEILERVMQARRFDGLYTSIEIILEAIQGLLDLYNKEKEKNKIINLMAEELNDFYDDNAFEYRKRTIEDTIKKFEERCK